MPRQYVLVNGQYLPVTGSGVVTLGGRQGAIPVDSTPTEGSINPITSGGVKASVDDLQDQIDGVTSIKINDKQLNQDITLTAEDVGARPDDWTPSAEDIPDIDASKITSGVLSDDHIASADTWNAKSTVSVSSYGTATTEVNYITINGVERKIAGGGGSGGGGGNVFLRTTITTTEATNTFNVPDDFDSGMMGVYQEGVLLTAGVHYTVSGQTVNLGYTVPAGTIFTVTSSPDASGGDSIFVVNPSSKSQGQVLKWNGSAWIAADEPDIPTKLSDLDNDTGFISTETDPTVPAWAKSATNPSYTKAESDELLANKVDLNASSTVPFAIGYDDGGLYIVTN